MTATTGTDRGQPVHWYSSGSIGSLMRFGVNRFTGAVRGQPVHWYSSGSTGSLVQFGVNRFTGTVWGRVITEVEVVNDVSDS